MHKTNALKILIRGGGEAASGIAYRLHQNNFKVCITETSAPLAVSRGVAFSEAVFDGSKTIMGVTAELVQASLEDIKSTWELGNIPLIVDPDASIKEALKPDVLVDAIMAKRKSTSRISDAPLVIGIGPGFCAGRDAHMVVESNHSNNLGKVILEGEAEKNTGIPVSIGGLAMERVIWAPVDGVFTSDKEIGDTVVAGELTGQVGETKLRAPISGILRGLIRSGVRVSRGAKLLEVDPVNDRSICNIITTKMWTIGDGVLQAIKMSFNNQKQECNGIC